MSGLSSCQNLASSLFFFFLRSAVSGTYRRVATVSELYPDFKIKKKKFWFVLGMDLGSVLPVPMLDTCWTRVLGQNRRVHAT